MSIKPGTRIGPYEVTSPLGEGGMGIVFRAHDTKLQRDVALKLLPGHFAEDADRLARFQREAQVLASLNHPNIAHIYGLEESNNTRCIVMELVEGDTLQERLKRGPIPLEEALPIAVQIVAALEAAHERGIVHRDLKPANIKLTPDERIKVLDFGLAKAFQEERQPALSNSPTLVGASVPGVILGTAAYMSPEQAKGKEADRSSDIWAFGCVLYEMLTGHAAFEGETMGEILGGVFKAEPDWRRPPAETPEAIRRLLRRCLQKERNQRLQWIGDARIEIEDGLSGTQTESHVAPNTSRKFLLALISALVVVTLIAVVAMVWVFRPAPSPPEMRVDITTLPTTDPLSFAISPDGRRLVFVASADAAQRLWLRPLDGITSQPLSGTDGASFPFWSPDSKSVAFFAEGKLKRIDIGGGLPQILTNVLNGRGGTWNTEGVILFAPSPSDRLYRVSSSGGQVVAVTNVDKPHQTGHRFPQFLPDGHHFLFFATGLPDIRGVYLGTLDSPETSRVIAAETAAAYMPPGLLLLGRQGTLVALQFDVSRKQVSGEPVTVGEQVSMDTAANVGGFSVSAGGIVAYRMGGSSGKRQLTWFDRSGKVLGTLGRPDDSGLSAPSLSPDGRRAAASRTVAGNTDVWVFDETRMTRFTFDASLDEYPVWSPDGSRIAFDSNRKGVRNLYVKPSNNAGPEELLLESSQEKTPNDWSPDGRFLSFISIDPKTARDLWTMPFDGDRKPTIFLQTNFEERQSQFSPDGRWIAYQSNESGHDDIYVRPFPGPGGQWQVSTSGGIQPRWARNGNEVHYIAPDGKLMAVPIAMKGNAIEPRTPVALFQTRIWGGGSNNSSHQQYDVTADGRFLINVTTEDVTASPITLILNWHPERGK